MFWVCSLDFEKLDCGRKTRNWKIIDVTTKVFGSCNLLSIFSEGKKIIAVRFNFWLDIRYFCCFTFCFPPAAQHTVWESQIEQIFEKRGLCRPHHLSSQIVQGQISPLIPVVSILVDEIKDNIVQRSVGGSGALRSISAHSFLLSPSKSNQTMSSRRVHRFQALWSTLCQNSNCCGSRLRKKPTKSNCPSTSSDWNTRSRSANKLLWQFLHSETTGTLSLKWSKWKIWKVFLLHFNSNVCAFMMTTINLSSREEKKQLVV